jgi:hypothetical protein
MYSTELLFVVARIENMLNDKKIRDALINRLLNRNLSRNNIFEEIAVKRGLGIVDVVANFKTPHCYEIKSDVDSLTRLKAQSEYFSDVFKKVTLVTTKKHLTKAELIVPEWWGITVAEQKKDKVTLRSHRKSGLNPKSTTKDLLSMLWNNELKSALNSLNVSFKSSDNRALLVNKLASSTSQKNAEKIFVQTMSERQKT